MLVRNLPNDKVFHHSCVGGVDITVVIAEVRDVQDCVVLILAIYEKP